jgi:hypothetical protein
MRKNAQRVSDDQELLGRDAVADLGDRTREIVARVKEEAEEHPLRTVALAAGAGFVLGGGLFTPLTARTMRAGLQIALRMAVLPALTRGLAEMASSALDTSSGRYRANNEAEERT